MRRLLVAALAAVFAPFAGCSSGDAAPPSSDACVLSSDCNAGLVCLFRVCSTPCREDRDCAAGSRCLDTAVGDACVAAAVSTCDATCPSGTVCGADEHCRTDCSASSAIDCAADQVCTQSICVGTDATHDPGLASYGGSGGAAGGGASGTSGSAGQGGASGLAGSGGGVGGSAGGASDSAGQGGASGSAAVSGAAGLGGSGGVSGVGGTSSGTGGSGGGAALGSWPDSPTAACSDGTKAVDCSSLTGALATQDGAIHGAVPTYALSQDGTTITDSVTGLEWTKAVSSSDILSAQASGYCAGLSGGFRAPNMMELLSILDLGRDNPAVDPSAFGALLDTELTTSVELDGDPVAGDIQHGDLRAVNDDTVGRVRCVRGPSIAWMPVLTHVAPSSYADARTGLVWQSGDMTGLTWTAALSYCAESSVDGATWRLPSMKELLTLADYTKQFPALPSELTSSAPAPWIYWTSSPAVSDGSTEAHTVGFDTGDSDALPMSMSAAVRCVRDASM